MFQYWTGPERQVELLIRTPSTRRRLLRPVNPRMYGEPWAAEVFWMSTPGTESNASGTVRICLESISALSMTDAEYGDSVSV